MPWSPRFCPFKERGHVLFRVASYPALTPGRKGGSSVAHTFAIFPNRARNMVVRDHHGSCFALPVRASHRLFPSVMDCPWVEKASTPSTSFSFGPNDHIPLQTHLSPASFRPPSSPTTTTKLKRIYGVLHSLPRLPHSTGYGVLRPWQCW